MIVTHILAVFDFPKTINGEKERRRGAERSFTQQFVRLEEAGGYFIYLPNNERRFLDSSGTRRGFAFNLLQ